MHEESQDESPGCLLQWLVALVHHAEMDPLLLRFSMVLLLVALEVGTGASFFFLVLPVATSYSNHHSFVNGKGQASQ